MRFCNEYSGLYDWGIDRSDRPQPAYRSGLRSVELVLALVSISKFGMGRREARTVCVVLAKKQEGQKNEYRFCDFGIDWLDRPEPSD